MDKVGSAWTPDSEQNAGAPGWLSASAAAAELGVSQRTIRRAIARGDLPAAKQSGVYRIAREDLARYETPRRRSARRVRREPPRLLPFRQGARETSPELPRPLTPLIGREPQLALLSDLVRRDDVRLVTLIGPGGVGKTRLALRVAERVASDCPDGVWFVGLAPIREPDLVATTIVRALGVVERADRRPIETLTASVRDRRVLLILDNFEHLLAAAPLVTELLTACPNLLMLVTSRARLNLSGEHALRRACVRGSTPGLAAPAASRPRTGAFGREHRSGGRRSALRRAGTGGERRV